MTTKLALSDKHHTLLHEKVDSTKSSSVTIPTSMLRNILMDYATLYEYANRRTTVSHSHPSPATDASVAAPSAPRKSRPSPAPSRVVQSYANIKD